MLCSKRTVACEPTQRRVPATAADSVSLHENLDGAEIMMLSDTGSTNDKIAVW